MAADLGDAVKVLKVDTDENQALATQLQVPPPRPHLCAVPLPLLLPLVMRDAPWITTKVCTSATAQALANLRCEHFRMN